jgi:vancomycin resistance protein YoaR
MRLGTLLGGTLLALGLAFVTPAVAAGKQSAKSGAGHAASAGAKSENKKGSLTRAEKKKLDVLARFSTKFPPHQPRVKNIRRIADLMDGVVIEPGHSFSVNHFIGKRTEENGFVMAPSILDAEMSETVGGGISQFATTLYNALYDAGFPIIEHKPHSHFISRYPAGVEATLSWPGPDLSFKNDSESPLVIETSVSKDRVSVKLLGKTPGRKVTRKAPVELERKAQAVEHIADASVSPRKPKVEREGAARRSVQVTRIVENPGKRRVDEDVVIYLPLKKILRVHPCRLPKGHKDFTGEPCGTSSKKRAANAKKSAESAAKARSH